MPIDNWSACRKALDAKYEACQEEQKRQQVAPQSQPVSSPSPVVSPVDLREQQEEERRRQEEADRVTKEADSLMARIGTDMRNRFNALAAKENRTEEEINETLFDLYVARDEWDEFAKKDASGSLTAYFDVDGKKVNPREYANMLEGYLKELLSQTRDKNRARTAPSPNPVSAPQPSPYTPPVMFSDVVLQDLDVPKSIKDGIRNEVVLPDSPVLTFGDKATLRQFEKDNLKLFEKIFKAENKILFSKLTAEEKDELRKTLESDRAKLRNTSLNILSLDKKNTSANLNVANILRDEGKKSEAAVFYQRAILNSEQGIRTQIREMLEAQNFKQGIPTLGDIIQARKEQEVKASPFVRQLQEDVEDYIEPAKRAWTVYVGDPSLTWLRNTAVYSWSRTLSESANRAFKQVDDLVSGRTAEKKIEEAADPKK